MRAAAAYGDRHASVYDRLYGSRFEPDAAVQTLQRAADGGRVLELGVGTGRLAIPLAARGVEVDGIEASPAMIKQLRVRQGGDKVGVIQADLSNFVLPQRDYQVAVCAVSTLFMLPGPAMQTGCLKATAAHLRPGGQLFVEVFRPDPTRFDADGRRVEHRPTRDGTAHVVHSSHDAPRRCIQIIHELSDDAGTTKYAVDLHYATPDQLDAMAAQAGFEWEGRWHDWNATPATDTSTDPISVYRKL